MCKFIKPKADASNPPEKRGTAVDSFWGCHTTVDMVPNEVLFKSEMQSLKYLEWRAKQYPLLREMMGLWGNHQDEIVLDYGCGPGSDLIGFLLYSNARRVIGIDISKKALDYASRRIALHNIPQSKVTLIQTSDSAKTIPLPDNSVDYIYSLGVLHHASNPDDIMAEFYRILKPSKKADIMVYNRESVWFHLYVAYKKKILDGLYENLSDEQAFARTTDSELCPISRCYKSEEFLSICLKAKFQGDYAGGYYSLWELDRLKKYKSAALSDSRLSEEHRVFLGNLTEDALPENNGKYAGIGGTYHLLKGKEVM